MRKQLFKNGRFAISIDDKHVEYRYIIDFKKSYSIDNIVDVICDVFNGEIIEAKRINFPSKIFNTPRKIKIGAKSANFK